MRNLNGTEHVIMTLLIDGRKTITISDMVEGSTLFRGKLLKAALRDLEDDGLITSRLPSANTPMRLYGLPTDDWVWPETTPMPNYLNG